ncbi:18873_t:CDS:2 [Entrophospora sp. SA101]|nr:18873_t:CDS:2 [Entrophospora sp. SA101]
MEHLRGQEKTNKLINVPLESRIKKNAGVEKKMQGPYILLEKFKVQLCMINMYVRPNGQFIKATAVTSKSEKWFDGDNVEDIENVKDVVLNENSCRTKVKCSFCEQLLNHSKKMSVTDIINKVAAKIAFLDEPIKVSVFVFNSSFNHGIYAKDVLVTSGMLLSDGGGRANEK